MPLLSSKSWRQPPCIGDFADDFECHRRSFGRTPHVERHRWSFQRTLPYVFVNSWTTAILASFLVHLVWKILQFKYTRRKQRKNCSQKIYICFKCCCTFVYVVTCIAFWFCCMVELIAPMFDFVVRLFLLVQTVPNPWTPMLLLPMILLLASKEIMLPCTSSLWPPTSAGPSQRPLCAFVGICVFKPKNN